MRISNNNYFTLTGFQNIRATKLKRDGAASGSELAALGTQEETPKIHSLQQLLPSKSLKPFSSLTRPLSSALLGPQNSLSIETPPVKYDSNVSKLTNFLDRAEGPSSRETGLVKIEFFEATRDVVDPNLTNTDVTTTQDDLHFLRSSVEDIVQRQVINDPTSSADDINAVIDSTFGSGVSDLFTAVRTDDGDGNSSIRILQTSPEHFTNDEKATLAIAVENARAQFISAREASPWLDTQQATDAFQNLSQILGKAFDPDLSDLQRGLFGSVEGGAARAIDDLSQKIDDSVLLTSDQKNSALQALKDLSKLNEDTQSSISTPPIFDDLRITFRSGSYQRAFSPDEIATVLENTPDFAYSSE